MRVLLWSRVLAGAAVLCLTAGCASGAGSGGAAEAGSGTGEIKVWAHQGQQGEVSALQKAVADFNAKGSGVTASLKLVPEADYAKTIAATAVADLPDVLEFDGPTMSSLVYEGKLSALDDFVDGTTRQNATASILAQGTSDGRLYGLGMFDSGLGLYANRSLLDAAGVKYPAGLDDAWSASAFGDALRALAKTDADGKVLDVGENNGFANEWGTYAFSPALASAGASLLTDGKAAGTLDSDAAVSALRTIASWRDLVDANTDTKAFSDGRVAMSWSGHWMYPSYSKALGANLVTLPLPDFGNGTKTGQGSWAWGITSGSKNGRAAGRFLDHLMSDGPVEAMTKANGAPPATRSVLATSELYRAGGPLALFAEQLERTCGTTAPTKACVAVPRPVTAGYPAVTKAFSGAFAAVYKGSDPKEELSKAAREIDRAFADNDGYRTK